MSIKKNKIQKENQFALNQTQVLVLAVVMQIEKLIGVKMKGAEKIEKYEWIAKVKVLY